MAFLGLLLIGALIPKEEAQRLAREKRVDDECEKMMADSALGDERRLTRQICEQAKAAARK
ncbi:hypothetical protein [Ramlibacter sp.]|uniref:hypothetical protein n=1 Tax=Ramlibacter sp. TaxID=1917967 RepID=UPI003D13E296